MINLASNGFIFSKPDIFSLKYYYFNNESCLAKKEKKKKLEQAVPRAEADRYRPSISY